MSEAVSLSCGQTDNKPAKLPGLVVIFVTYLWFVIAFCFVIACVVGYIFLTSNYYFPLSLNLIFGVFEAVIIAFVVLAFRAARSISARHENTPERCQFLLLLSFVCAILSLAHTIWMTSQISSLSPAPWSDVIPAIANTLYTLVMCTAWHRYFGTSRKVKTVFKKTQILPVEATAIQSQPEATDAAGEMGLVTVLCWLALVYRGVQCALYLMYIVFADGQTFDNATIRLLLSSITGIVAPLLIIYAINTRAGKRHLVFWGLGLWLAASVVNHFIFAGAVLSDNGFDTSIMLQVRFPSMLNVTEALALAVWWYMAVSEKAKAWFADNQAQTRTFTL